MKFKVTVAALPTQNAVCIQKQAIWSEADFDAPRDLVAEIFLDRYDAAALLYDLQCALAQLPSSHQDSPI